MSILLIMFLVLVSIIIGIVSNKTSQMTKIPILLVFILIGIALQFVGLNKNETLVVGMNQYTQMISITMIYVMAGYAMEMKMPSKVITVVGSYPSIIMTTVVSIVVSLISFLISGTISLLTVMIIIAVVAIAVNSTPVLFITAYNKLDKEEQANPKNLDMLRAAVFDQLPVFLFILIPMVISIGIATASGSVMSMITQIVLQIVILTAAVALYYFIGKQLFKILIEKMNNYILLLLLVAIVVVLNNLVPLLAGQYLTAGAGIGLALNDIKNYDIAGLKQKFQLLVGLVGFPIMFVSLGLNMKLSQLFSLKMLLLSIVVYLGIVVCKTLIIKHYLEKFDYNSDEIRIGIIISLLTGATYINMAITFQPVFVLAGFPNLYDALTIVGLILYIFSILITPILIGNKNLIKKLFKLN